MEIMLTELHEGDFFGELALFDKEHRSSTVRAKSEVRILTIDEKNLIHRIQNDPSLAFRVLKKMSKRIRDINAKYADNTAQN